MHTPSVLVTGGAGFIGSHLARHFGEIGWDVTICDWLGTGDKWRNLATTAIAGIVAPDRIGDALDRTPFDLVLHMGAISATTERDVDLIIRTNIDLSLLLWDHCAARQIRFIYASSAATYGDGRLGFDDDGSTTALARLRPLNAYGWSKLLVDRLVAKRIETSQPAPPQWAGLRFFNVFGPNEYHKGDMRSVVCKIFEQVRDGRRVTLFRSHRGDYADGGQQRDFIAVDDCVAVVGWLAASPRVSGLFNVGTGKARSWNDLAKAVFDAAEIDPGIDYIDIPPEIRRQYQYFTEARMGRLMQAGFVRAFTSLEEGVRRYVHDSLASDQPYR